MFVVVCGVLMAFVECVCVVCGDCGLFVASVCGVCGVCGSFVVFVHFSRTHSVVVLGTVGGQRGIVVPEEEGE